jgi:uncharacterized protein YcfJ
MLAGLIAGVGIAAVGGVIASLNVFGDKEPAYAEVLNVVEATETVRTPPGGLRGCSGNPTGPREG